MLIVNSPMLFEGIWNNIKPQIDESTRKKVTIIGSGYKEKLLELVINKNSTFLYFNNKRLILKISQAF